MSPSAEQEFIGGGVPRPAAPGEETIGNPGAAPAPAATPAPEAPQSAGGTEAARIEAATRAGTLTACPFDYSDGTDWQTIHDAGNPFRQLYLDAAQHATITDEQVAGNARVLGEFWEGRRRMLVRGGDRLKARFGDGTIEKAQPTLQKAAAALADAARRQAYFEQLENRRLGHATTTTEAYLRRILAATDQVMKRRANQDVVEEGQKNGFTLPEAEQFLVAALRGAGLAPLKTVNPPANQLHRTWTVGGQALPGEKVTVMGQDVYSLAEAAQVLFAALANPDEREKAIRNLESGDYLLKVADALKEPDTAEDLKEINRDKQLNRAQRQLKALYLLGPGLPFQTEGPELVYGSPAELLDRAAQSSQDFRATEKAFVAGLLPIWLQTAGTAALRKALAASGSPSALGYRKFLHAARPDFPLWVGDQSFTSPAALAAYIRRDERTWELVYGSLTNGSLGPWLAALGQPQVLARQAQLAGGLLAGVEPTSEPGRRLTVQALLEALDPQTATPALQASTTRLDLTGLSGETLAERTLTLTNATGGPVRVRLGLAQPLEGVRLSAAELFFDQRAPGQQLSVLVTGNPAQMPRDGEHTADLHVATAYGTANIPVVAGAVFPQKEFWQLVIGAGLALAAIFGGVRWLLGQALGTGRYEQAVVRNSSLPLRAVFRLGGYDSLTLVGMLLLLVGLVYVFGRVLLKLSKPRPTL